MIDRVWVESAKAPSVLEPGYVNVLMEKMVGQLAGSGAMLGKFFARPCVRLHALVFTAAPSRLCTSMNRFELGTVQACTPKTNQTKP